MTFNAFTPLAGGVLTRATWAKPVIDLTGGLNFTRHEYGVEPIPTPPTIGAIGGLLPLLDDVEYNGMLGPVQNGPWTGKTANPVQVFPNIQGGLVKVTG